MKLDATLRKEDFGSAGSRRLTRQGLMPGELYGKKENIHVVFNAHDFDLALRHFQEGDEVEVAVEGKTYKCIFKELQENIMTGVLMHADFQIV